MLYQFCFFSAVWRWLLWKCFRRNTWPVLSQEDDLEITLGSWVIYGQYQSTEKVGEILQRKNTTLTWPYQAFAHMLRQENSILTQSVTDDFWRLHHTKLGQALARTPWLERATTLDPFFSKPW